MSGNTYCIVVADDRQEIVDSLTNYLEQLANVFKDKVDILQALCATDVLRIISNRRIDALFLDYHFEGGISGDEIIDRISDPFSQKFIVLMSARKRQELEGIIIKRHKRLGSRFKFLRKPFDYLEVQAKYLEIEEFISNRPYPFPLSYAEEALQASSTSQGRITAIKDVVESVAKYSVAVLMADLNRLKINEKLVSVNWNSNLTLGAWLVWLKNLLDRLAHEQNTVFMPELINFLTKEGRHGISFLDFMFKFKDEVRDPELGHGYTKEERWYAELAREYTYLLESFLDSLAFTSQYILLVPESMDFLENAVDGYEYKVRFLMGTETRFAIRQMRSQLRLKRGAVYIYDQTDRALSLHPFMVYHVCRQCSLARLYLLDNMTKTQIVYNAFCNHRLKDRENRELFTSKFSALKKT